MSLSQYYFTAAKKKKGRDMLFVEFVSDFLNILLIRDAYYCIAN